MRTGASFLRGLGLGAILGFGLAPQVRAEAALPKDSPFLPKGEAAAVVTAAESYDLAAVSVIGKKTSVNIFDKQAKRGRWVTVGETVDGFTAKSYDPVKEIAVVTIGGAEKTLALRKPSNPGNGPNAAAAPLPPGVNAWNVPPAAAAPIPMQATAENSAIYAATRDAPTPPALPQPPPATPGTIAHQEQEARMLVSDLLEIGMAQRKAYEEAQKKKAGGDSTPPPAAPGNPPAPAGN